MFLPIQLLPTQENARRQANVINRFQIQSNQINPRTKIYSPILPQNGKSVLFFSKDSDRMRFLHNSGFAIDTREGFKIFDSDSGRLCYERAVGGFSIVEMLYSSSLLAIVGAGEQASLSPRRLCLFNIMSGAALRELTFLTSVLAIRVNKKRSIVLLQDKTHIYDSNSL